MQETLWHPRLMKQHEKLQREGYRYAVGICEGCFELTPVLNPCCSSAVYYEGNWLSSDHFEELTGENVWNSRRRQNVVDLTAWREHRNEEEMDFQEHMMTELSFLTGNLHTMIRCFQTNEELLQKLKKMNYSMGDLFSLRDELTKLSKVFHRRT
jgi:hypothetical protein